MRVFIQRTNNASVSVENEIIGKIKIGFVILLGIEHEDTEVDCAYLIQKITQLRVFPDTEGKMNLSLQDVSGSILLISQFTLHASTKKGNRPSFIRSARPEQALVMYQNFIQQLKNTGIHVETGKFGSEMQVQLVNDGPVSIWIDSKSKE